MWEWAGTFRLRETNIGVDPTQITVQLRMLLENAGVWARVGVYTPLEAAVRFHHRMVEIHLFPHGNGRHARIAADLFLRHHFDHPAIEWASGFDLQADDARRDAYIDALRNADGGDFDPLLKFVGLR